MTDRILKDEEIREDFHMDPDEFWQLYGKDEGWIQDFEPDEIIEFPHSKTKWRASPNFVERVWHTSATETELPVSEGSATCVAIQVEGPDVGMRAILKTRMEIPTWLDSIDEMKPGVDYSSKTKVIGPHALVELVNLKRFTRLGSTCTPRYIDHHLRWQAEDEPAPGGYMLHILMEKVPGRNLLNFGKLPMSERDQVRIAFGKAMREFLSYGCRHEDRHIRNLMWDCETKKCTIIDLEAVAILDKTQKPLRFNAFAIFYHWCLAGPCENTSIGGIDPMVPHITYKCEPEIDDATLEKLAADAAGKEAWFMCYY